MQCCQHCHVVAVVRRLVHNYLPVSLTSCRHAIPQRTVVLSQRFAVMVAVYRHSVLMELAITYLSMKLIPLEVHMIALLCELLRSR